MEGFRLPSGNLARRPLPSKGLSYAPKYAEQDGSAVHSSQQLVMKDPALLPLDAFIGFFLGGSWTSMYRAEALDSAHCLTPPDKFPALHQLGDLA